MVAETQDLRKSLRRNPFLRILEWANMPVRWPGLYHFVLGMSYDNFRGTIKFRPIIWAMLSLVFIFFADYLPRMPWWAWSLGHIWSNLGLWEPARPLWLDAMLILSFDYALARLESGRLALAPHHAAVGDEVALLQGSTCPFVVKRKWWGQWVLVGDCCVDGMMEGEAWREEDVSAMEFI
jgi:hypothetical protein